MSQLEFLQWLQTLRMDGLNYFFLVFTLLGLEYFYLITIPIIYWCFNREIGFRTGIIFILSMFGNNLIKDYLQAPRPSGLGIEALYPWTGTGFSFPSGHGQATATFWSYLAYRRPNRLMIGGALTFIFLVGLSRVYFSLHYPTDVLGGIFIGIILVAFLAKPVVFWEKILHNTKRISLVSVSFLPALLLLIYHEVNGIKIIGALTGFSLGYGLSIKRGGFNHQGTGRNQILKALLGISFSAVLYLIPKLLLPEWPLVKFLSYWLLTLSTTLIVPELFIKFGLAQRDSQLAVSGNELISVIKQKTM